MECSAHHIFDLGMRKPITRTRNRRVLSAGQLESRVDSRVSSVTVTTLGLVTVSIDQPITDAATIDTLILYVDPSAGYDVLTSGAILTWDGASYSGLASTGITTRCSLYVVGAIGAQPGILPRTSTGGVLLSTLTSGIQPI